jgi:glycosyltransferase involved in cell wall biosynthesis
MRVIMLAWEYPPNVVGGLARHVYDLSHALAASGVKVDVITGDYPDAPPEELDGNLNVYRVNVPPSNDFVHWVQNLNAEMGKKAAELLEPKKPCRTKKKSPAKTVPREPTVIHAHDWLSQFAGKALKEKYRLPLVATIHATEHGRNHGIHNDTQKYISGIEWDLCYEAWRVICCSYYMKDEVASVLGVPPDKMDVIPNGVDPAKFKIDFDKADFRRWFAKPNEKIILFVGRMVPEKGVQVLIEAMPDILAGYNDAKLVIVGGGHKDHLVKLAHQNGVAEKVFFTGYVDDETLLKLYNVIDVAVYPSLYEPFGIVALEAMIAKVPVVVSDVGGLREVVDHGVTGLSAWADNPDSLAWAVLGLLKSPYTARNMARNAYRKVMEQFNWGSIANRTAEVYERVWSEYWESDWRKEATGAAESSESKSMSMSKSMSESKRGSGDGGKVDGSTRKSRPGPVADPEKL